MMNSSLTKDEKENSPFTESEAIDFIEQINTEIVNYTKVMKGHKKTIRFNPKILRIAMGIFLRSQSAYEDLIFWNIGFLTKCTHIKQF